MIASQSPSWNTFSWLSFHWALKLMALTQCFFFPDTNVSSTHFCQNFPPSPPSCLFLVMNTFPSPQLLPWKPPDLNWHLTYQFPGHPVSFSDPSEPGLHPLSPLQVFLSSSVALVSIHLQRVSHSLLLIVCNKVCLRPSQLSKPRRLSSSGTASWPLKILNASIPLSFYNFLTL